VSCTIYALSIQYLLSILAIAKPKIFRFRIFGEMLFNSGNSYVLFKDKKYQKSLKSYLSSKTVELFLVHYLIETVFHTPIILRSLCLFNYRFWPNGVLILIIALFSFHLNSWATQPFIGTDYSFFANRSKRTIYV